MDHVFDSCMIHKQTNS